MPPSSEPTHPEELIGRAWPAARTGRGLGGALASMPPGAALAVWVVGWLGLVALFSLSPPVDNAEQLTWVRSLEWGYYKHPPAPTALLAPLVALFGLHAWVSYLAAGLVTGAAIWLNRALLIDMVGRRGADLATLATLCVGFYNGRLLYFNHDTVLLLCASAAAWCCWQAFERHSTRAWLGVGLALGVGALAKYQVALLAVSVFAWWLWQQGWRDPVHRRGLLWAALVALTLFAPHLLWLVTHDFQPVQYATQNSQPGALTLRDCSVGALRWIGDQLSQLAGPLLLGAVLWARQRRRDGAMPATAAAVVAPRTRAAGVFLFCFGLLPLAIIPLLGLLLGAKLHMNWGSPYMGLTCAALMHAAGWARWQRLGWRPVWLGFALVQAVLAASVWLTSSSGVAALGARKTRNFASQEVADRIAPAARHAIGGPVRVIAGPQRLASVLALRMAERPLVLIDGRYDLSPWIPADPSRFCAVLWVGERGDAAPFEAERHEIGNGLWWAVQRTAPDADRCE